MNEVSLIKLKWNKFWILTHFFLLFFWIGVDCYEKYLAILFFSIMNTLLKDNFSGAFVYGLHWANLFEKSFNFNWFCACVCSLFFHSIANKLQPFLPIRLMCVSFYIFFPFLIVYFLRWRHICNTYAFDSNSKQPVPSLRAHARSLTYFSA